MLKFVCANEFKLKNIEKRSKIEKHFKHVLVSSSFVILESLSYIVVTKCLLYISILLLCFALLSKVNI